VTPDDRIPPSAQQELERAFHGHDLESIRRVVETYPAAHAMIDAPVFPFDAPAIVHFAGQGDLGMIDLLLDLGADPNRRSEWWAGGFHALHHARGAVAERLMEGGATPDACGAAQMDRRDLLLDMLDADPARVHERGGDGQTPLHFARSREVVDLLLERGADIDAKCVDHRSTPAEWMLQGKRGAGRFAVAEYLAERGASVDVFLAAALGLTGRLRSLLEVDPTRMELRTSQGEYGEKPPSSFHIYTWTIGENRSPLQVAAQFEQADAFELLRTFASPKDRLMAACSQGRAQEADTVLREWPRLLEQLSPAEQRALPDAAWAGNVAAVELMLSIGFDPAARGQDGGTALHCAAWQGQVACVEAVLRHPEARRLIEVRDRVHSSTALGWCCHGARHRRNETGDYPAVAQLLLDAGALPGPNLDDAPPDVLAVFRAAKA
jgi:ankyrin repeat protein